MLIDYPEISKKIEDTAILQRMGFDPRGRPLAEDGIAGKLTKGGRYLDPRVITTPIAREALKDLLAGAQEEGRPNDGAWVRGYMRNTRGPWCAGSSSTWLARAHGDGVPYKRGARRLGLAVAKASSVGKIEDPFELEPDDLLILNRDGPDEGTDPNDDWSGHVGVIAAVDDDWIYTIEGNVGSFPAPVRVFRRARKDPGSPTSPFLFGARWDR